MWILVMVVNIADAGGTVNNWCQASARCCHVFAHQLVICSNQRTGTSTTIVTQLLIKKREDVVPANRPRNLCSVSTSVSMENDRTVWPWPWRPGGVLSQAHFLNSLLLELIVILGPKYYQDSFLYHPKSSCQPSAFPEWYLMAPFVYISLWHFILF